MCADLKSQSGRCRDQVAAHPIAHTTPMLIRKIRLLLRMPSVAVYEGIQHLPPRTLMWCLVKHVHVTARQR